MIKAGHEGERKENEKEKVARAIKYIAGFDSDRQNKVGISIFV